MLYVVFFSHLEILCENETDIRYSDDPEIYDGAKVGVQLVGRRFQEEKILAISQIIGDALGKTVV